MKAFSSRGGGPLSALSTERRVKGSDLNDYHQLFDSKFLRKPGSRLRNLQDLVSRDNQTAATSTFSANFISTAFPLKEKSEEYKIGNLDKLSKLSALEKVVKKSHVNDLLQSISLNRSPSVGRLGFQEGPTLRSSSMLLSTRPSSSFGRITHTKTSTMTSKVNFGNDFDTKKFFNTKGRPSNLLDKWLKTSKGQLQRVSNTTIHSKKQKISEIHHVLNISENKSIKNRPNMVDLSGKSPNQNILSKISLLPPSAFHLGSSRPTMSSGGILYQKISANNARAQKRCNDNTTSQLLFENQKLFEKKKRAFKDAGFD
jgi:hypothetical protein